MGRTSMDSVGGTSSPLASSPQLAASPGFSLVQKNTFLHFVPELEERLDGVEEEKKPRRPRCYSDLTGEQDKVEKYRSSPSPLMQSPRDVPAEQLSPVPSESDPEERAYPWAGRAFVPGKSILQQVSGLRSLNTSGTEPEFEPQCPTPPLDEPDASCSEPEVEAQARSPVVPPSPSGSDARSSGSGDLLGKLEEVRLRFQAGLRARGSSEIIMDGFDESDGEEQPGTPCYLDRQAEYPGNNRFGETGPNPFQQQQQMPMPFTVPMQSGVQWQFPGSGPSSVSSPQNSSPQAQTAMPMHGLASPLQAMSPQQSSPMSSACSPNMPPLPASLQQMSMQSAAALGFLPQLQVGQQSPPQDQASPRDQSQGQMQGPPQIPNIPGFMPNFAALQAAQAQGQMPIMPVLFGMFPTMPGMPGMPMMPGMPGMPMPGQQGSPAPQETPPRQRRQEQKTPPKQSKDKRPAEAQKERTVFQPPQRDPNVPITELTLMLKNIPNKYKPDMMLDEFKDWRPFMDFFYMPIDFKNNCNLGYAFVNFHDVAAADKFREKFHELRLPLYQQSNKVLQVSEARVQGLDAYVERFRNSSVMGKGVLKDEFKPMLFDKNNNGAPMKFPEPEGDLPALGPRFRRQR